MRTVLLCSLTVLLCSCMASKGDSIDNVVEKSMKEKEGVDIKITPESEKK